jgi:hypothetical protein
MDADFFVRFLVTAFFAVVFLQSAADKLIDPQGNRDYFSQHFKNSPLAAHVANLLWVLTAIELTAGGLCGLGLLILDFRSPGMGVAGCGVAVSGFALLCLMVGQRLAKDYAGAAVVAAYFAVALVGLRSF